MTDENAHLRVPNEMQVWPEDWPLYKQVCFGSWDSRCDVLIGPCACGAWHSEGEFELKEGVLYRYGELVPTITRKQFEEANQ